MRNLGDSIIAGDAIAKIYFLSQANTANQLKVSPDRAITYGSVFSPHLLVNVIDRNMAAKLEERAENGLPLRGHLKAFGSEKLFHLAYFSAGIITKLPAK